MKQSHLLVSAAIGGLLFAVGASADNHGKAPAGRGKPAAKFKCEGANGCKGQGACGGKVHRCAGKNECKGKGWVYTADQAACDALKTEQAGAAESEEG